MNDEAKSKGRLLVVSGPSGAGKGMVLSALMKKYPERYIYSVSATTRNPRPGEVNGREYFFKSRSEFESEIEKDGFLEHAVYNGNHYGTPKEFVNNSISAGKNVILEIDVQGALQIKRIFPEALFVFITPESYSELEARLRGRATETEDAIAGRLSASKREAPFALLYDYIVINRKNEAESAAEDINSAVRAFSLKPAFNHAVLETFFG